MKRYQLACLIYITFGGAFYGYDFGIISCVLGYPEFIAYYGFNNNTIGAFNSSYYAACAVGTAFNAYLPNRFGRLWTIRIAVLISFVGIALQTAAVNFPMILVGRIIGGVATGIIFGICPVYASEISPPNIRGRVGALFALNISLSNCFTTWFGLGMSFVRGTAGFRVLYGLQLIPGVLMLVGSLWMPESPRWLALVDRYDQCLAVLKKIHGDDTSTSDSFYAREFHQIKAQIELEKSERLGIWDIITKPSYRRRVLLIMVFYFFQQATGILPQVTYQVKIYQLLHTTEIMSLVLVGVWGSVSTFAILSLGFWFDKIGRRNALFISYAIMIPASIIIIALWAAFEHGGNTNLGLAKGVNVGIFLTTYGYAAVMNTFGTTYGSEIMPTQIRAMGVACGFIIFNAMGVLMTQTAPLAIDAITWRYFIIWLILDCVYVVIVYYFYPETKNKSLEEMAELFGDKVAVSWEEMDKYVDGELQSQPSPPELTEKITTDHIEKKV
ncbi:MFS transporter [Xylogone sp. PMI_703]|nr:MFS transporter [Xylogone sp. PMI_703]